MTATKIFDLTGKVALVPARSAISTDRCCCLLQTPGVA